MDSSGNYLIMYASNCREALSLADDLLLHNFLVATDSKQVANDINMGCTGIHGLVVAEIKGLFGSSPLPERRKLQLISTEQLKPSSWSSAEWSGRERFRT